MSAINIRNVIALLLVLTAANLAASFAALYAVRTIRNDFRQDMDYLRATVSTLCMRTDTLCPPPPDTHQ